MSLTPAERRKALFIAFFVVGCFTAYPLLTPEETRNFSRVQKEFRVLAIRDGKPVATSLATLPKDATFLLPTSIYELTPDVHRVVVLENSTAWQLVQYEFDNTVSTVSRYRAFRDRIEPLSHRMTFHPGLVVAFVVLMLPAWLLAWVAGLLWNALSPPPAPPPASRAPDESPAVPRMSRRSSLWIGGGAAVVVVIAVGLFVAAPDYADYTKRAKISEAILALSATRTEIHEFYLAHRRLPRDTTEGNLASTLRPYSSRLRQIRYEEGMVTGVIANIEPYDGKEVILQAKPAGDKLEWTCIVRGIPARDVPGVCRPSD